MKKINFLQWPVLFRFVVVSLFAVLLLPQSGQAISGLMPVVGKPAAVAFSLPDLDGKVHKLADYRGKVVLVNFWATWCPPCRKEMPSMQRVWERLRAKGFVILAVDVGEDEDGVIPFMMEYDVDFPILLDQDSKVVNQWPVRGLPTSFLLDREGRLIYRAIGGREWDRSELFQVIENMLKMPN